MVDRRAYPVRPASRVEAERADLMSDLKPFEKLAALKRIGVVAWWVFPSDKDINRFYEEYEKRKEQQK
jgi:hypothetical protein